MDEARMPDAQAAEIARISGRTQNYGVRSLERANDRREFAVAHRTDDDEVMRNAFVFAPQRAAKNGDRRSMPFRLPARGEQPRKLSFVGQNQYVCVSQ